MIAAGNHTDFFDGLPDQDAEGRLLLLDAATGKEDPRFAGVKTWLHSAAFSPDGRLVLGAIGTGIRVWEFAEGKVCFTLSH